MAYTLISFIGTGRPDSGYAETEYHFPDGTLKRTGLFLEALFACKYKDINKLILLGTCTSRWDQLIKDDIKPLHQAIAEAVKTKTGFSAALYAEFRMYLQNRFNVSEVIIAMHTDTIDEISVEFVFKTYHSLLKEIDSDSDILLDITHSFRSMPILLYQALQFAFIGKNIELVYGELQNKVSIVRNLSGYWAIAQISHALTLFRTKCDGTLLASLVKPYSIILSRCIQHITEIIQTNFSLQITEVITRIEKAFFPKDIKNCVEEVQPSWMNEVKEELQKFVELHDIHSDARTLFRFADFLMSKQLNTQAIITLQIAVEIGIAEYAIRYKGASSDVKGDYSWWQHEGRSLLHEVYNYNFDIKRDLKALENMRNQIAHGGARQPYKKGYPSAANISAIYQRSIRGVKTLFNILRI